MRIENSYYIWNKSECHQLSTHFSTEEFECHCRYPECKEQRLAVALVDRLQLVRDSFRSPIVVTSGFRCKRHQMDEMNNPKVETVPNSTHTLGNAADITCTRMSELDKYLPTHFKAIGTARTFRHIDLRDDRVRRWNYK